MVRPRFLLMLRGLLLTWALLSFTGKLLAQEDQGIKPKLSRDFGYGFANQEQGTFSYRVTGPPELDRVELNVDGRVLGQDTTTPFENRIQTGDFADGSPMLTAIVNTASRSVYRRTRGKSTALAR